MISRADIIAHHKAHRLKYVIAFGSEYVSQNPLDFEVLGLVAEAYLNLRFVTEAENLYEILYSTQRTAQYVTGLGLAKSSQGNFRAAKALFKEALLLDSDYVPAWSGLSEIHKYRRNDPILKKLQKALQRSKRDAAAETSLQYLMCKAMNDQGKWSSAWRYAERGAAMSDKSYDPGSMRSWHNDQATHATADLLCSAPQTNVASDGLIFIVGMPRSGTSLLETMLSNCPDVLGCGELCFVSDVARVMPPKMAGAAPVSSSHAWMRDWTLSQREELAKAYVDDFAARSAGGTYTRFVDKFPGNIICLPHIAMLFPNARILRMHRNPLDNCISNFLGQFAGGNTYTYDVDHLAETFAAYKACGDTMMPRLPNPVLDIRYESLVSSPNSEMKRILSFLDIPWTDACIAPERSTTPCVTRSRGQIRDKITSKAVGRWRRYGDLAKPLARALHNQGVDLGDAEILLDASIMSASGHFAKHAA